MKTSRTLFALCMLALALVALPAQADETQVSAVDLDQILAAADGGDCAAPAEPAAEAVVAEADLFQGAEARGHGGPIGGGNCNQATCTAGQFCCNYSCSTCAPLGGYCTQQICPPVE